ncbi:tigger transposable element-derived protein 1-like [Palaemon carinicauda]|uniref:tigger transposable element-derived protein 1-like n=1 Tax=Palaemon carinicauda TaxID=392227 RepID=UPI0035B6787D
MWQKNNGVVTAISSDSRVSTMKTVLRNDKQQKRTGLHSVVQHGEAVSSDVKVEEEFMFKFRRSMVFKSYKLQPVFNCDETGLSWKKMPRRTFISEEEKNPRPFKKYKLQKKQLNVMWRSNNKAWVTSTLLVEWVIEIFGHHVKKYFLDENLPLQALLLMDSSLAHPSIIEDNLMDEFKIIKIRFLLPNTTPILKLMDQ